MATIKYTSYSLMCPNCAKGLRRGLRDFGPSKIKCGHCNEIIDTGLDSWQKISIGKKILLSIKELLWPSWLRINVEGIINKIVINIFAASLFYGGPLGIVAGVFYGIGYGIGAIIGRVEIADILVLYGCLIGFFSFPILNLVRYLNMIKESIEYSKNSIQPSWKSNVQ